MSYGSREGPGEGEEKGGQAGCPPQKGEYTSVLRHTAVLRESRCGNLGDWQGSSYHPVGRRI